MSKLIISISNLAASTIKEECITLPEKTGGQYEVSVVELRDLISIIVYRMDEYKTIYRDLKKKTDRLIKEISHKKCKHEWECVDSTIRGKNRYECILCGETKMTYSDG